MAEAFILTNATTLVHGFDFTCKTNQVSVNVEAEDLDATTFCSDGFRTHLMGLKDVSGDLSGFWDHEVDATLFEGLGKADRVVTAALKGEAGAVAYMYRAGMFSYEQFGSVGELTPFSLSMSGTNTLGVVRGKLAVPRTTVNATGVIGTAVNLGATLSTEKVYATFHVYGEVGTTITIQLQSSANSGFTSPTTVRTIGPLTATGGVWVAPIVGPVTDPHWRFNVSAVTGEFTVAAAIGIK